MSVFYWLFVSDLQIFRCGWIVRSGSEDPPAAVGHGRTGEVRRSFSYLYIGLWSPLVFRSFFTTSVSHQRRQVSESNNCVLQRRHGLPPPVRPHKRAELPQRQKLDEYVTTWGRGRMLRVLPLMSFINPFFFSLLSTMISIMSHSGFTMVKPGCETVKHLFWLFFLTV